ncbi:MAG: gliding motility protein GldL [Bacteroidales bacterium]|nr:gliding motility protein GldL [Bacteroidales bacterium]
MAKLYGLGAAVVIVGALFKIMHWNGWQILLPLGLIVEAIIFMFSAFEPLHEELDWTLVYPELAGMTDPDEVEGIKEAGKAGQVTLERFEDLVSNADVGPAAFKRLGDSLEKLSSTTANLSDLTEAASATSLYVNNVKSAANSVGQLSNNFVQSNQAIQESVSTLTQSYGALAQSVKQDITSISENSRAYGSQLENVNKNLSALNAAYELQLRGANDHLKETQALYGGFGKLMTDLQQSAEETQKYRQEISQLSQNLASLNSIYGNMLAAMSVINNPKGSLKILIYGTR